MHYLLQVSLLNYLKCTEVVQSKVLQQHFPMKKKKQTTWEQKFSFLPQNHHSRVLLGDSESKNTLGFSFCLTTNKTQAERQSRYFSMHHRTSLPPKKFIVKSHIPFCNEATYIRKLYQSLVLNYLQIHHNCSTEFARR